MQRMFHHRLLRMERAVDGLRLMAPCAVCGHARGPGVTPTMRVRFASEPQLEPTPDFCPACGKQLVYRLTFDERD
jgi:hypothetical protein